jgi:hypothetical protein
MLRRKLLVQTSARTLGIGIGLCVTFALTTVPATAATYEFTVPVSVTSANSVNQITVTCAVGSKSMTFTPQTSAPTNESFRDTPTLRTAPVSVTIPVKGANGTFTGSARIDIMPTTALLASEQVNPTNYICVGVSGATDAYVTLPLIAGTLPTLVR